jgi:hypothetical protein
MASHRSYPTLALGAPMKTRLLVVAVLALLAAPNTPARAHAAVCSHFHSSCCSPPARWSSRYNTHDARLAITTQNGDVTLVLTDDHVAMQLSDRVLRKVRRELRDKQDDGEDNVLAETIKTVVISTVRALLDHSVECSVRDLRDVSYRQGRLVFTTEGGKQIFDSVDVSDQDVLESFSESDAQLFVREFHRCKGRLL